MLNRGDDNHLAIFAVDPGDGRLTLLKRRSVEGESPRDFTIAPGGRFLLVANQASNSIELFARDPLTGLVTDKLQSVPLDSPAFLQLLPRGRSRAGLELRRPSPKERRGGFSIRGISPSSVI
ncbi:6-phosphogluconolactonase [compost metagenome]